MNDNRKMHFEISERKVLLRLFDVFFVLGTLYLISIYFNFDYFTISKGNFYWAILLSVYLIVIGTIFDMYNLQTANSKYQILKSSILTTAVTTLCYILTPILTPTLPKNRLQIILFFLAILFALLIWRNIYITFLSAKRFIKNVIFIGHESNVDTLIKQITDVNPHIKVIGTLCLNNEKKVSDNSQILMANLKETISKNTVSEIIIIDESSEFISVEMYNSLLSVLERGIVIRQYSEVYEDLTNRLPIQSDDKELYKFFPFSRSNQNKLYLIAIRIFDILFAIGGLVFLVFIIPFISFLNLFWNKGPLFYTQERVGQGGHVFKIYKLRSMVIDAEKDGAVFATTNDSRVTAFGKFLRKTRLDEIPQFINVIRGDMSIIGPRPERPIFVNEIASKIPLYQTRHVVKPGLTGWAQVNYAYGENIEDSIMKLRYDLYYIKHRSIFLDLNVIIKTLNTVLFFKGQ